MEISGKMRNRKMSKHSNRIIDLRLRSICPNATCAWLLVSTCSTFVRSSIIHIFYLFGYLLSVLVYIAIWQTTLMLLVIALFVLSLRILSLIWVGMFSVSVQLELDAVHLFFHTHTLKNTSTMNMLWIDALGECPINSFSRLSSPHSTDWETSHWRFVASNTRSMGNRPQLITIRAQIGIRTVRRCVGRFMEQHNTGRHQNTQIGYVFSSFELAAFAIWIRIDTITLTALAFRPKYRHYGSERFLGRSTNHEETTP